MDFKNGETWDVRISHHTVEWAGKIVNRYLVYHGPHVIAERPTHRGAARIATNLRREIAAHAGRS